MTDPLTDADRARIRAEEVERLRVRAELEGKAAPVAATVPAKQERRQGLGCFGYGYIIALAVIVLFVYFAVKGGGSSNSTSESMDVGSFGIACQHAVSDQLKAPATAQYQNFFIDQSQGRLTGDSATGWRWQTYVDSQNSFGANIRTNFICTTEPNGTEAHVVLEDQ